jgi:hypothetical protein
MVDRRSIPIAEVRRPRSASRKAIADHVCLLGYRVRCRSSPNLDRIINADAEIPNRTLDLGKPKQLHSAKIACSTVDQDRLRSAQ